MGLVDIRSKMASLRASAELQVTPRKKRTFDIAFLTGQSENSSEGTTTCSSGVVSSIIPKKPSAISLLEAARDNSSCYENDFSPSGTGGGGENETCRNLIRDDIRTLSEATNSSTNSSSIDIMTNASFGTSDSSESPDLNLGGIGITARSSNNSRRGKNHKYRQSVNNNNRPEIKSFLEEIRLDSKKSIEINQTSSGGGGGGGGGIGFTGRNIKDNLQQQQQFSGLFSPIHSSSSNTTTPTSAYSTDFRLPHLASTFVFLPQMHMTKFPIHFPGSLSKGIGNGTDLTNYTNKCGRGGFSSEQQYIAAATAAAYPYHYPNFLLQEPPLRTHGGQQDLIHHRQQSSLQQHQQQSQSGGGGGGLGIQSNSSGGINSSSSGTVATLLPPSLTALSLPAQNVCAKCNIGFRMTSDLVYHMRSHHKRETDPLKKKREDKLKCPVCHETFRERHHLTRHMTAHQDRAEEIELEKNNKIISIV